MYLCTFAQTRIWFVYDPSILYKDLVHISGTLFPYLGIITKFGKARGITVDSVSFIYPLRLALSEAFNPIHNKHTSILLYFNTLRYILYRTHEGKINQRIIIIFIKL